MKAIFATTVAGALMLLTGCASTTPSPDPLAQVLARHDAALARMEMELAQLGQYVKGSENHQDEALVALFARLAEAEQVLHRHAKQLGRVQVRSSKDFWIATPKKPVALP